MRVIGLRIFLCCLFLTLLSVLRLTDAANSAMSIDLGAQFLKMALIKPGVPMETVLNRNSQRKTPMAIAIKDEERYFGDEAIRKGVVKPKNTFTYFADLIGKQFNDTFVSAYQEMFPHLQLQKNERRGTVDFVTDIGVLPVETMLGMVLWNARQEVEAYAGQPMRDAVITIPSYFGQLERKAVEVAAQIADLNLLQQMGAGTAAGLNYGVFRHKEITAEPQNLLIYDVGATKTLVSIVQFKMVNETSEAKKEPNTFPQMETIGLGYDRALGGIHLTLKLRDLLAQEFKKQHPKTQSDITQNAQAMAKLLKEADRVKQVLSANVDHFAHVESVFEDRDFRVRVTREQLEQMFREFEPRHLEPISDALKMAQLDVEQLHRVVLMGAGTRMPRLQDILADYFKGKELGRFLNTDESIALGAVYHAARLTKGFKVKRFEVKEMVPGEDGEPMSFTKWLTGLAGEEKIEVNMTTAMSEEEIREAKKLLAKYEKQEKAKAERAAALNALESSVYEYSNKLEEKEFTRYGQTEELDTLRKHVAELKEWLEDVPETEQTDDIKKRRRELMAPVKAMKRRQKQKEERPKQFERLVKMLEETEKQTALFEKSKDVFTEGELQTLTKLATETKEWFEAKKKEADELKDNQDATFSTDDVKNKANAIDREVKFLFNRLILELRKRDEAERAEKKAKEAEEAAAKAAANATISAEEVTAEEANKTEPVVEVKEQPETGMEEEEAPKNGTKTEKVEVAKQEGEPIDEDEEKKQTEEQVKSEDENGEKEEEKEPKKEEL